MTLLISTTVVVGQTVMLGNTVAAAAPAPLSTCTAVSPASTHALAAKAKAKKAKKSHKSRLQVTIAGSPQGYVRVSGPHTKKAVTHTAVLRVHYGRYTLRARTVHLHGDSYAPSTRRWKVNVKRSTATIVTVQYAHVASSSPGTVGTDPAPDGQMGELLVLVNQSRSQAQQCGDTTMPPADPLVYDSEIAEAAQAHAQDMSDNDYFEHDSLDGRTFADRILATDYDGAPAGENIATGFQSADEAMQGWLASPGHCLNLMDPDFDEMGLGFASRVDPDYSEPITYWVQDFGYALNNK